MKGHQKEIASQNGVAQNMFNPYDLTCLSRKCTDYTGILETDYFLKGYALYADWLNVGECLKDAMNNSCQE